MGYPTHEEFFHSNRSTNQTNSSTIFNISIEKTEYIFIYNEFYLFIETPYKEEDRSIIQKIRGMSDTMITKVKSCSLECGTF